MPDLKNPKLWFGFFWGALIYTLIFLLESAISKRLMSVIDHLFSLVGA